jgi:hypothetical protein
MMRHLIIAITTIIISLDLLPGSEYQKQLVRLKQHNQYEITQTDENTIHLKHRLTGKEKYIDTSTRAMPTVSNDMQFFDLINADTNQFKYKYLYKKNILVGNLLGYPMVITDLDSDNKLDIIGSYKLEQDLQIAECAIFELQSDSSFQLQKIYPDSEVYVLSATDLDNDQLAELNFERAGGQSFYNYESRSAGTYPDTLNFSHKMWQIAGAVSSETFDDMDGDGITDVIYVGDDSLDPRGQKVYVAEYKSSINNFEQVFRFPPPEWLVSGFSTGDFDGDGFKEFVTGSIHGDVYVCENTGDDAYQFIYSDTISTPNAYMTCATNDMDHNGKIEFFMGGSSFYYGTGGTRVYWFEADGDNRYRKVRSFFLSGTDVLGTTELYSYDVNGDDIDDLVFGFGGSMVILIWDSGENHFILHYLDWLENWNQEIQSINIYDLYNTDKADLIVSIEDFKRIPRIRSDIYRNNFITNIDQNYELLKSFKLYQNYPNPFNPKTTIPFYLPRQEKVTIKIFDLTGKEVKTLINKQFIRRGNHQVVWDGINNFGKEVSSGLYLYQIQTEHFSQTKKLLLIK